MAVGTRDGGADAVGVVRGADVVGGLGGGLDDVVVGVAGFGFGGAEIGSSAVSTEVVFCFGGVGGGAGSPGFKTLVAAVVPSRAVKKVGGSSPSSRGLTLK